MPEHITLFKMQILDEDLFQQPVIFLDADVDMWLSQVDKLKPKHPPNAR